MSGLHETENVRPTEDVTRAYDSRSGRQLRALVALGCRVLAAAGADDYVWGHVSLRDPNGLGVWMKAQGPGLEEITEHDVLLIDFDGNILAGDGRRHSEYPLHTEVLRARPDLNGVVHTHPPNAVAVAASDRGLLPLSTTASLFVPPAVPSFAGAGRLVRSAEAGAAVASALGDHNVIMLAHHGIVTAGSELETAVTRAVLLERACEIQLKAGDVDAGGAAALEPALPADVDRGLRQVWAYLVRRLHADPIAERRVTAQLVDLSTNRESGGTECRR